MFEAENRVWGNSSERANSCLGQHRDRALFSAPKSPLEGTNRVRGDTKTQVKNSSGGTTISQYDYAYDALGRRTNVKNSGSAFAQAAFNKWTYNDRNELIDSGRYLGTDVTQSNSPVAAEHRAYGFDPIGNRITATEGTAAAKSYQANLLNEYTTAAGANLTYDADGNLTSDGTRTFTYDAENRLVRVEPVTATNGSVRVTMAYDYLGRRVQKVVEEFNGSTWSQQDDVRFVYMGWNVIEERHTSGGVSTKKNFVWGLDLSQSMDGAGGIGGLLAVVDEGGNQLAFLYDANGNVGQLVDESGAVVARYEYDAFGQVLVAAGVAAEGNCYRFSTKHADLETGLVYYGYRFYSPEIGRWVNRDPAQEEVGGVNLFAFVRNDPIGQSDKLGLFLTFMHGMFAKESFERSHFNAGESGERVLDALIEANKGQDEGQAFEELERHYNRPHQDGETDASIARARREWEEKFRAYAAKEIDTFEQSLATTSPNCMAALNALGRLTHTWQDFYAHAISDLMILGVSHPVGFRAWMQGYGGDPESHPNLWPSSYHGAATITSGEHPNWAEPVGLATPEFAMRREGAISFVAEKYKQLLPRWWGKCKCRFEQARGCRVCK